MSARSKRSSASASTSQLYSIAENRRRVFPEHLFLDRFTVAHRAEVRDVFSGRSDAGCRPIRPPQDLVRDLGETRDVSRQQLWRDTGQIEMHVRMPAREKERLLAVQRTASVREDDGNVREV